MNGVVKIMERNHAIDLMKFFAAIMITNSHMQSLYPEAFKQFATGGAIGDAMFFFCSGYLLMLGKSRDFFNWYKRRINRIFPTIITVAIISIILFGQNPTLKQVIINNGNWFVQAIFVFYALFWFVKRFVSNKLWKAYVFDLVIIIVWLFFFWDTECSIFGTDYVRWPFFFFIMLMGASVCNTEKNMDKHGKTPERSVWIYLVLFAILMLVYFGYYFLWMNVVSDLRYYQIVLLPVLMGIVYSIYKICSNSKVLCVYRKIYWPIYYISACCLEIYLSGGWSFIIGRKLIHLFPLNIIITFLIIFVVAYLVKVISNFLLQTFKTEDYNWMEILKL